MSTRNNLRHKGYGRNTARTGRGYEPNPAVSASQYGMAQAVLSGVSDALPVDVAQELISRTPKRLRSLYAKVLAKKRKNSSDPIDRFNDLQKQGFMKLGRGKSKTIYEAHTPEGMTYAGENKHTAEEHVRKYGGKVVKVKNPSDIDISGAEEMAESFHGRPPQEYLEIVEMEEYQGTGAIIGDLLELCILVDDGRNGIPINWESLPQSKRPKVVCDPKGKNICFIGGDQKLELDRLEDVIQEVETDKSLLFIGQVDTIAYFADKHHLEGPKEQKNGIPYEHEFGEEGGEKPFLVYDCKNCKMWLVGGSYTVESEGIRN